MQDIRAYRAPVVISSLLVLPLMILEWINLDLYSGFPVALFAVLWILPLVFTLSVAPIARGMRSERGAARSPATLLARLVLAAVAAWMWVALVRDQLPCFLGVPNCD